MKLHGNAALSMNKRRLLCRRVVEEEWSLTSEGDLERALADRAVLAHELVHATVPEHAVSFLVDGRAQVVPVGLRLHADPLDGDELALDAEQLLDDALRLLVAPLAEGSSRMMPSASTK